jgi:proteic killer suppression protein
VFRARGVEIGFSGHAAKLAKFGANGDGLFDLDTHNVMRYKIIMIRSFSDDQTSLIWQGRRSRKLPLDMQAVALRKLRMLNQVRVLEDLRVPPGNRLEALRGDRAGQHAIRINDQWRLCFVWKEGGAFDVGIVDHHG